MSVVSAGQGLLVTAAVLGITHGFEPDHAAGISALTDDADDRRHAAFVGGSFAVGHVVVVLAWVAVLATLGHGLESTAAFDTLGTIVPGIVLALVAAVLAVRGVRRLREPPVTGFTAADGGTAVGFDRLFALAHGHVHHAHDSRSAYLRTGIIGSLFSLSPPLSMLTLVSTVVPTAGANGAVGAVAVYALAITGTMVAIGAGIGEVFAFVRSRGQRVHAAVELVTSVVVLGFAAQLLL